MILKDITSRISQEVSETKSGLLELKQDVTEQ